MSLRTILEKAVELYNEPVTYDEIDIAVTGYFHSPIENLDPYELYLFVYGTAITDLSARLGVDVKAFLASRGETQKEVYDNAHIPTRREVENLTAAYNAGKEDTEEEYREGC